MDTAKAIQLLHRLQDEQFDGIHGDERRDALEMAVRALSGEGDTIYRQAAIDALGEAPKYKVRIIKTYAEGRNDQWFDDVAKLTLLPSAQSDSCEGCKHFGKWEDEVEYGYSSPCTCCKRRVGDHYER